MRVSPAIRWIRQDPCGRIAGRLLPSPAVLEQVLGVSDKHDRPLHFGHVPCVSRKQSLVKSCPLRPASCVAGASDASRVWFGDADVGPTGWMAVSATVRKPQSPLQDTGGYDCATAS